MTDTSRPPTVKKLIAFPSDLEVWLRVRAREERRSFTAQVIVALELYRAALRETTDAG